MVEIKLGTSSLKVFGTDFYWPARGNNPYFDQIPEGVDILVCHGPAKGFCDGDRGCDSLIEHIWRVKPRLVVSGHIHSAHGIDQGSKTCGITFVNAAICCGEEYALGWEPIVVDL